jgi:hypothetical protein
VAAERRYRCGACGNLTRFDVVATRRTRSYYHYSLGGELAVDEEEVLSEQVEAVTCRWCERADAIEVLPAPARPGVGATACGQDGGPDERSPK